MAYGAQENHHREKSFFEGRALDCVGWEQVDALFVHTDGVSGGFSKMARERQHVFRCELSVQLDQVVKMLRNIARLGDAVGFPLMRLVRIQAMEAFQVEIVQQQETGLLVMDRTLGHRKMRVLFRNVLKNTFDAIVAHSLGSLHKKQDMRIVCVLDMDETLGVFYDGIFHVRPKTTVLLSLLRLLQADVILWSLGEDRYVEKVVNGFLPSIREQAYKLFARAEANVSLKLYRYPKASEHIRKMYEETVFLIAVDDNVKRNMDAQYDVRIQVTPYKKPNPNDRVLTRVCEKIIQTTDEWKRTTQVEAPVLITTESSQPEEECDYY